MHLFKFSPHLVPMVLLRFFIRQRRGSLHKPFPPSCRNHMLHAHDLATEQTSRLCHVCLKEKKLPLLYLYTILIPFTALSVWSEWKLAAWWWWWCLSAAHWCQLSCTDKMPNSQRAASERQSAAFQDVDVKQKIKLQSPRAEFQVDEFPSTGTTTRLRRGTCQYISMLLLESIVGFCNTEVIHNLLHRKPTTGSLQLCATVVQVYQKNKNLRRSSTSLAVGFVLF